MWHLARRTYQLQQSQDLDKREADSTERSLLLIFLHAELSAIRSGMSQTLEYINLFQIKDPASDGTWDGLKHRAELIKAPVTRDKFHRLHVIDPANAARLARLAGFCWSLENALASDFGTGDHEKLVDMLRMGLPTLIEDLDKLTEAGRAAVAAAGIKMSSRELANGDGTE